jgi:hypothetical protein
VVVLDGISPLGGTLREKWRTATPEGEEGSPFRSSSGEGGTRLPEWTLEPRNNGGEHKLGPRCTSCSVTPCSQA